MPGYIVCDNEAIHGTGDTADAAWSDFVAEMAASPGIVILGDNEDIPDEPCNWVRERDYKIHPATAALIEKVKRDGGAIAWQIVRGVACLPSED